MRALLAQNLKYMPYVAVTLRIPRRELSRVPSKTRILVASGADRLVTTFMADLENMQNIHGSMNVVAMDTQLPPIEERVRMVPSEILAMVEGIMEPFHSVIVPGGSVIHPVIQQDKLRYSLAQDVLLAEALLRAATLYVACRRGQSVFASCTGISYLTSMLGGKVMVGEKAGKPHDGQDHAVIVPSTSILSSLVQRYNVGRPQSGDTVIPEVRSIHFMVPETLPPGSIPLAYAEDGTSSVVSVRPGMSSDVAPPHSHIGCFDHPELQEAGTAGRHLWSIMLRHIVIPGALAIAKGGPRTYFTETDFRPTVVERLHAKSVTSLSEIGDASLTSPVGIPLSANLGYRS
jgi:hypothetical protein